MFPVHFILVLMSCELKCKIDEKKSVLIHFRRSRSVAANPTSFLNSNLQRVRYCTVEMAEREKAVKCLRELRNLLTDDEDLKLPIHDEKFLIRFVRGKKYDVEKAHETVRKYYTLRKKRPKIFKIMYPSHEKVNKILKDNIVMKLKNNDPDGLAIVAWNTNKWEVEKYNMDEMIAAFVLVLEELLLSSVETQINGIIFIANDENLSLAHIKEMTPGRMKSMFDVVQGSFPLRLKKTLVVKEPAIIDMVMKIIKPFMSVKFQERLKFHGYKLEKLHELIPAKSLPESYGGLLTDDEAYDEDFKQNLMKRDSYYQELLDYGFGEWDSDEEDTYM